MKLIWAFVLALLDDLTEGLNSFCKDSLDISKVLLFERALLNQQQKKVRGLMFQTCHDACLDSATPLVCLNALVWFFLVRSVSLFFLCLALQGKEVSQKSVTQFYENWISRQNTLSSQEDLDDALPPPSPPPAVDSSHHAYAKLKNQASKVSWGSSISRWVTSVFLPVSAYVFSMCKVRTANIY